MREICGSKSIGLALSLEVNLSFLFFFTLYLRAAFPSTSPQEAYIWRGDLTEGFLHYEFGRLIHGVEGLIFGILRYYTVDLFLLRYYKTKVQACIQPLH